MIAVKFKEDSDIDLLGRLTAPSDLASGAATGVPGEGRFLQVADVSTITCKVFDRSSGTPDTETSTPTVTVATSVLDTVVTSSELWAKDGRALDAIGYNFRHSLPGSNFPNGGSIYRVEYTVTLTGGAVYVESYEGPCESFASS